MKKYFEIILFLFLVNNSFGGTCCCKCCKPRTQVNPIEVTDKGKDKGTDKGKDHKGKDCVESKKIDEISKKIIKSDGKLELDNGNDKLNKSKHELDNANLGKTMIDEVKETSSANSKKLSIQKGGSEEDENEDNGNEEYKEYKLKEKNDISNDDDYNNEEDSGKNFNSVIINSKKTINNTIKLNNNLKEEGDVIDDKNADSVKKENHVDNNNEGYTVNNGLINKGDINSEYGNEGEIINLNIIEEKELNNNEERNIVGGKIIINNNNENNKENNINNNENNLNNNKNDKENNVNNLNNNQNDKDNENNKENNKEINNFNNENNSNDLNSKEDINSGYGSEGEINSNNGNEDSVDKNDGNNNSNNVPTPEEEKEIERYCYKIDILFVILKCLYKLKLWNFNNSLDDVSEEDIINDDIFKSCGVGIKISFLLTEGYDYKFKVNYTFEEYKLIHFKDFYEKFLQLICDKIKCACKYCDSKNEELITFLESYYMIESANKNIKVFMYNKNEYDEVFNFLNENKDFSAGGRGIVSNLLNDDRCDCDSLKTNCINFFNKLRLCSDNINKLQDLVEKCFIEEVDKVITGISGYSDDSYKFWSFVNKDTRLEFNNLSEKYNKNCIKNNVNRVISDSENSEFLPYNGIKKFVNFLDKCYEYMKMIGEYSGYKFFNGNQLPFAGKLGEGFITKLLNECNNEYKKFLDSGIVKCVNDYVRICEYYNCSPIGEVYFLERDYSLFEVIDSFFGRHAKVKYDSYKFLDEKFIKYYNDKIYRKKWLDKIKALKDDEFSTMYHEFKEKLKIEEFMSVYINFCKKLCTLNTNFLNCKNDKKNCDVPNYYKKQKAIMYEQKENTCSDKKFVDKFKEYNPEKNYSMLELKDCISEYGILKLRILEEIVDDFKYKIEFLKYYLSYVEGKYVSKILKDRFDELKEKYKINCIYHCDISKKENPELYHNIAVVESKEIDEINELKERLEGITASLEEKKDSYNLSDLIDKNLDTKELGDITEIIENLYEKCKDACKLLCNKNGTDENGKTKEDIFKKIINDYTGKFYCL